MIGGGCRTLGAALLAAVALLGLRPAAAQPAPSVETLIRDVRVLDVLQGKLGAATDVLIKGNTVAAIGPAAKADPGATIVEGHGRTLMPGLIDDHVHLTFSALTEAQMLSPDMTPQKAEDAAAIQANNMLMRGFTAVRDMGGPIFGLKRRIDSGKSPGPRIWPSGAIISQTSGHGDFRLPSEGSRRFTGKPSRSELLGANFIADGRDEVLTAARENLRMGASQIKIMAGGGTSSAYDPLDVTQYTLDEMKAAVEAADDWNTYVAVHAYTPKSVRRAVEAGVKCIEHGHLLDDATVQLLADKGVWLSTQNLVDSTADMNAARREKRRPVIEGNPRIWAMAKAHHVKLAWGTDFLFEPEFNAQQNAFVLKLRPLFTNAEILKLVTHDNAQLLALSGPRSPYAGKLGVVEEGALADLIMVDGDPLTNLDLIADPEHRFVLIMKDGVIYKGAPGEGGKR